MLSTQKNKGKRMKEEKGKIVDTYGRVNLVGRLAGIQKVKVPNIFLKFLVIGKSKCKHLKCDYFILTTVYHNLCSLNEFQCEI